MHDNYDASARMTADILAKSSITQPSEQRLPSEFLQILVLLDRQNRERVEQVR